MKNKLHSTSYISIPVHFYYIPISSILERTNSEHSNKKWNQDTLNRNEGWSIHASYESKIDTRSVRMNESWSHQHSFISIRRRSLNRAVRFVSSLRAPPWHALHLSSLPIVLSTTSFAVVLVGIDSPKRRSGLQQLNATGIWHKGIKEMWLTIVTTWMGGPRHDRRGNEETPDIDCLHIAEYGAKSQNKGDVFYFCVSLWSTSKEKGRDKAEWRRESAPAGWAGRVNRRSRLRRSVPISASSILLMRVWQSKMFHFRI